MSKLAKMFSALRLDAENSGEDDRAEVAEESSSTEETASKEPDKTEQNDAVAVNCSEGTLIPSSGLDITKDRILEIACIITDGKLTKQIEGPELVISQTKDCLDSMDEWCKTHHSASERVLQSELSECDAEAQVLDFVWRHVTSGTPLLAGNSVYVDLLFLKIHTKKRNRLLHKRLNAIVFVSYNRKMKNRFQLRREKKGKGFDPLVIEEFDWDNEWADSSHVFPRGSRGCDIDENGLNWQIVDEAVGASSSLRGRNLPRTANKRGRNSNPRQIEVEVDSDSGNEEEEDQDPLDDADVTDCEDADAPNGSNAGGEDMEAVANDVNEFDDGY